MELIDGEYKYTMAGLIDDIQLGRGAFRYFEQQDAIKLIEFLEAYRESRVQALTSLMRVETISSNRSGYAEVEWLESHEWWPK